MPPEKGPENNTIKPQAMPNETAVADNAANLGKIKRDADTIRNLINKLKANNDPNSTDAQTYQRIQECLASIERPDNLSVTPDQLTRIPEELVSIITDLLETQQGWDSQARSTNLKAVARALAYMIYNKQITFPEQPTSAAATSGTPETPATQTENQPKQNLEQAVQELNQISDDNARYRAIQALAPQLKDTELLKQALRLVEKMQYEYWKYKAIRALAPQLKDKKLLEKALGIVGKMQDEGWKSEAIQALAPWLQDKELLEQVLGIVGEMQNEYWKYIAEAALKSLSS